MPEGADRYTEAIAAFVKAIEIDPSEVFGYYAKGWCHELSGDDSNAMVCYEQGIDMDKSYPYIFLMRGQIYLKRGEMANAEADFEKVLQLDTIITELPPICPAFPRPGPGSGRVDAEAH